MEEDTSVPIVISDLKGLSVSEVDQKDSLIQEKSSRIDEETKNKESTDAQDDENDCIPSIEWVTKKKHVFVLSTAGKPIYSRYGNEDKCAWLFGVMQTLVSFIQSNNDCIRSIHAGDTTIVFVLKKSLILVAVSKTLETVPQLALQLNYVYNQIASTLTLTKLNKIYEQRQNYDLRRLLTGVERLIDHLLVFAENDPGFLLESVHCLALPATTRDLISTTITNSCSKIKNLVFAILLADNRLITTVHMKKYTLDPSDLHLLFNLIAASESFKAVESWTPLCLPRFDASGYLYAHVSYLADDCAACLVLLTVDRDVFHTLSAAKCAIVDVLRKHNCLAAINAASLETTPQSQLVPPPEIYSHNTASELRHFLYKSKVNNQYYASPLNHRPPYETYGEHLLPLYRRIHQYLHTVGRPLKLAFEKTACEAVLGWDTKNFELYVVFEPTVDTGVVVNAVKALLQWIKRQEDVIFQVVSPFF